MHSTILLHRSLTNHVPHVLPNNDAWFCGCYTNTTAARTPSVLQKVEVHINLVHLESVTNNVTQGQLCVWFSKLTQLSDIELTACLAIFIKADLPRRPIS